MSAHTIGPDDPCPYCGTSDGVQAQPALPRVQAWRCTSCGTDFACTTVNPHPYPDLFTTTVQQHGAARLILRQVVIAVDGAESYPARAPYDRIIATCAAQTVPTAWLKQAAPGAVIITDVHGLLGGTLARLTVDTEGTAIGRFVPYWTGFMQMRRDVEPEMPDRHRWGADEPNCSSTDVDPAPLRAHGLFGFVVQWHLPDVSRGFGTSDDGKPALCLFAPDGLEAFIETEKTHGRYRVNQAGPRRLWDIVEQIHEFWQNAGQPRYDRFGLTATAAEQYVWLDNPDSPHRWPLPIR